MRRRWGMLLTLALSGCMGFDEYYQHDGFVYEPAGPAPCGCASGTRPAPAPVAAYASPNRANVVPVPQSREPELLR